SIRYPLPPLRLWAISPDFALVIAALIKQYHPAHIFELGSGSSTLISSYTLEKVGAGKVTSLEHLAQYAQESAANTQKHGLDGIATVVHSPLIDQTFKGEKWRWYDLSKVDFT